MSNDLRDLRDPRDPRLFAASGATRRPIPQRLAAIPVAPETPAKQVTPPASPAASRSAPVHTRDLNRWVQAARPGHRVVYFVGYLGRDKARLTGSAKCVTEQARTLAASGRITLVQRRLSAGRYEYIAQKLPAAVGKGSR